MAKTELQKYLDPKVLNKIGRLDLQARLVVEGFISGMHKSPFKGFSVEFAEHREYVPGDDLKHLDWKVLGKTDRLYIKQYEEETNLRATFLVDVSESMRYGQDGRRDRMSKYHYSACVAASLAQLLLGQQDAVALATFDEDLRSYLPHSSNSNQIKGFVHALDVADLKAKTGIEHICHNLVEKIARRGMVCLISDLFVDIDGLIRGLQHFRHHSHEVMVLHVMDEDELTFPFQGNTMFRGLENAGRLTVEPRALREGYLEAMRDFCANVKRRCIAARIDYKLISTADHLDAALLAFLAARAAAGRKTGAKR
ncbi:MAG: DUF58 domain-containing protein [Phycisphaerae bacterium]|nr:DUF58 domain-containing protein [Phycisphaerae bacterium]